VASIFNFGRRADAETILSIVLSLLFFSSGSFGLTNIFGVRREVQIFLTAIVLFSVIVVPYRRSRPLKEPVMALSAVLSLFTFINTGDLLLCLNFVVVTVALLGLSAFHPSSIRLVSRILVSLCSIFVLMGVFQLLMIWFGPNNLTGLIGTYSSETGADTVEVLHPIQYLGFFDSKNDTRILGIWVPRFSSFAAEPSVMTYSFVVPGLLGLADRGVFRVMGMLVISYCIFMVQSGTVWLCLFCGGLIFAGVRLNSYTIKLSAAWLSLSIVLSLVALLTVVSVLNPTAVAATIHDGTRGLSGYSTVASSKQKSAEVRLLSTSEGLSIVLNNPLGYRGTYLSAGRAMVVDMGLAAGWFGIIVLIMTFYRLMMQQVAWVQESDQLSCSIAAACLMGTQMVVLFFSSYGWMTFSGFLALGLIAKTAEFGSVRSQASHNEHMPLLRSSTNQI
jgi:hypothetical protein